MNELENKYRAAPVISSPAQVDNAVLAAATRHAGARPQPAGGRLQRWAPAVSVLCVGVLSLTLVLRQGGAPVSQNPMADKQHEEAADSDSAIEAETQELVPDVAMSASVPTQQMQAPAADAEQHVEQSRSSEASGKRFRAGGTARESVSASSDRRRLQKSDLSQDAVSIVETLTGVQARQWLAELPGDSFVIELKTGDAAKLPGVPLVRISSQLAGTTDASDSSRLYAASVFSTRAQAREFLQRRQNISARVISAAAVGLR